MSDPNRIFEFFPDIIGTAQACWKGKYYPVYLAAIKTQADVVRLVNDALERGFNKSIVIEGSKGVRGLAGNTKGEFFFWLAADQGTSDNFCFFNWTSVKDVKKDELQLFNVGMIQKAPKKLISPSFLFRSAITHAEFYDWKPFEHNPPPTDGVPFLAFSATLINREFNPTGCIEMFFDAVEQEYVGAFWNEETSEYDLKPFAPEMWKEMSTPGVVSMNDAKRVTQFNAYEQMLYKLANFEGTDEEVRQMTRDLINNTKGN